MSVFSPSFSSTTLTKNFLSYFNSRYVVPDVTVFEKTDTPFTVDDILSFLRYIPEHNFSVFSLTTLLTRNKVRPEKVTRYVPSSDTLEWVLRLADGVDTNPLLIRR